MGRFNRGLRPAQLIKDLGGGCSAEDVFFDRSSADPNRTDDFGAVFQGETTTEDNNPAPVGMANPKERSS